MRKKEEEHEDHKKRTHKAHGPVSIENMHGDVHHHYYYHGRGKPKDEGGEPPKMGNAKGDKMDTKAGPTKGAPGRPSRSSDAKDAFKKDPTPSHGDPKAKMAGRNARGESAKADLHEMGRGGHRPAVGMAKLKPHPRHKRHEK